MRRPHDDPAFRIEPGQQLHDWRVDEWLANGGFAAVYRASKPSLTPHQRVSRALKVFSTDVSTRVDLSLEFKLAQELQLPAVLPAYDYFWADLEGGRRATVFVLELATESLWDRVEAKRLMTEPEALSAFTNVASVLVACSQRPTPVVHGDLHPKNILLVGQEWKVADFGIAVELEDGKHHGRQEFLRQDIRPPEHGEATDDETTDPRGFAYRLSDDIFAFGICLHYTLTGLHPFNAATSSLRFAKILQGQRELAPTLGAWATHVITRCTNRLPERYQSAAELMQDLNAWSQGAEKPASAVTVTLGRRPSADDRESTWDTATGEAASLPTLAGGVVAAEGDRTRITSLESAGSGPPASEPPSTDPVAESTRGGKRRLLIPVIAALLLLLGFVAFASAGGDDDVAGSDPSGLRTDGTSTTSDGSVASPSDGEGSEGGETGARRNQGSGGTDKTDPASQAPTTDGTTGGAGASTPDGAPTGSSGDDPTPTGGGQPSPYPTNVPGGSPSPTTPTSPTPTSPRGTTAPTTVRTTTTVAVDRCAQPAARGVNWSYCNKSGQSLANVILIEANLTGTNFSGSSLNGANLGGANLTGANLRSATFLGATINDAIVTNADFTGANIQAAHFINAVGMSTVKGLLSTIPFGWSGTTFTGTGLSLSGANLNGANISGATLTGVNLTGVVLTGANLTNVDLSSANLTNANLNGAIGTPLGYTTATYSNTTCPDGTNSNSHSSTCKGHPWP